MKTAHSHNDTPPKTHMLESSLGPICLVAVGGITAIAYGLVGSQGSVIAAVSSALIGLPLLLIVRSLHAKLAAERTNSANALSASQQFFERVLNAMPVTIFIKDEDSRYVFVNDAFCELRAMNREEILTTPLSKMRDEHGRATESEAEDRQVFSGRPVLKEERVFHPDTGQEIFRTVSKRLCHDAHGQALIIGSTQNTTVLRRAERTANEQSTKHSRQHHFLRFILNTIPIPIYVKDEELYYIVVNQAFAKLHGLPEEEIIGKRANEFTLSDNVLTEEMHEMAMLAEPHPRAQSEHCVLTDSQGARHALISRKTAGRNADGNQVIVGTYSSKSLPAPAATQSTQLADKPAIPYPAPALNGANRTSTQLHAV